MKKKPFGIRLKISYKSDDFNEHKNASKVVDRLNEIVSRASNNGKLEYDSRDWYLVRNKAHDEYTLVVEFIKVNLKDVKFEIPEKLCLWILGECLSLPSAQKIECLLLSYHECGEIERYGCKSFVSREA